MEAFKYHPRNMSLKGTILSHGKAQTRHNVPSPVPLVALRWDPAVEPHLVAADYESNLQQDENQKWKYVKFKIKV